AGIYVEAKGHDMTKQIIVVGAGPAGIRAVQTLVAHGVRPLLVDEAASIGGQIYRQPPVELERPFAELYGFEWRKASNLFEVFSGIGDRVDYRPHTLAWN